MHIRIMVMEYVVENGRELMVENVAKNVMGTAAENAAERQRES